MSETPLNHDNHLRSTLRRAVDVATRRPLGAPPKLHRTTTASRVWFEEKLLNLNKLPGKRRAHLQTLPLLSVDGTPRFCTHIPPVSRADGELGTPKLRRDRPFSP